MFSLTAAQRIIPVLISVAIGFGMLKLGLISNLVAFSVGVGLFQAIDLAVAKYRGIV